MEIVQFRIIPASCRKCRISNCFKMSIIFLIILVLLNLINLSSNNILGSRSSSLYGPDDGVYALNSSTIKQEIFNSKKAFLIEFYSSWCGHCIAYAPKWKQFAQDLSDWSSLVVIAGVDCADEMNIPTCRDFEIMGYPTLRILPPNAPRMIDDPEPPEPVEGKPDPVDPKEKKKILNTGSLFSRPDSMTKLKLLLMEALVPMFPNLLAPLNISTSTHLSEPNHFWQDPKFKNEPYSFLLLIFEANSSHVGLEVALKLSAFQNDIHVLRFNRKNPIYKRLQLKTFPAAAYLTRDGSFGTILLEDNQDLVNLLVKSTLGLARSTIPSIAVIESSNQLLKKSDGHSSNSKDKNEPPEDATKDEESQDRVSMEDLLHTTRYLLRNEIGLMKKIDGGKLHVLKNFIGVLGQYLPADRREIQRFFVKLQEWVLPLREIKDSQFTDKLDELEIEFQPWNGVDLTANGWKECKGTIPGRRGYTCGLWRLFHTLTVVAFKRREDSPVIPAIYGYMQEFFGCRECSLHFSSMVNRDNALELRSIRLQMRWLWKAHNIVNIRLKGTPSEDPSYPKQLYPTAKDCPSCYVEDGESEEFDEDNVEEYLMKVYSKIHRSKRDAAENNLLHGSALALKQIGGEQADKIQHNETNESRVKSLFGGLFSLTDIGIFMIVYLCIACLLVLGYLHFKIASKRRRLLDPIPFLRRFFSSRSIV